MFSRYKVVSTFELSALGSALEASPPSTPPPTQRRRSSTFSADTSPATVQASDPQKVLYRNRGLEILISHLTNHPKIDTSVIEKVAKSMCKISTEHGFESGVLVGPNQVLTCLHGLTDDSDTSNFTHSTIPPVTITVEFTYPNSDDASSQSDLSVKKTTPYFGDLVILELSKAVTDREPVRIETPIDLSPETLIHLHHANDGKLKGSVTNFRQLNTFDFLEKGLSLVGEEVSWGPANQKTIGCVTTVTAEGNSLHLQVETKSDSQTRTHEIVVNPTDRSCHKKYESGSKDYKVIDLSVLRKPLLGIDHAIVGHKSGDGGSGGIYITPNGDLFGIHLGFLKTVLLDDPDNHFRNRYLQYPWIKGTRVVDRLLSTTTFYDPYIEKQGKSKKPIVRKIGIDIVKAYLKDNPIQLSRIIQDLSFKSHNAKSNIFGTTEKMGRSAIRIDNEDHSSSEEWYNTQMQIGPGTGSTVSTVFVDPALKEFVQSNKENADQLNFLDQCYRDAVLSNFKRTKGSPSENRSIKQYPITYLYLKDGKIHASDTNPKSPSSEGTKSGTNKKVSSGSKSNNNN